MTKKRKTNFFKTKDLIIKRIESTPYSNAGGPLESFAFKVL
jgi:hypothetical protein